MSGLPLKLSVKFQINMAMRDVSNMANVAQFSNIVVPMLWFEIVSINYIHNNFYVNLKIIYFTLTATIFICNKITCFLLKICIRTK